MNKKNNFFFFLIFITILGCSFDDKTGIWGGGKKERQRIADLEKRQNEIIEVEKIYSSEKSYSNEVNLSEKISLTNPKKNSSWLMSNLNYQNSKGNIFLSGTENIFLKKKIGKNKFSLLGIMSSPLLSKNNILFSDNTGTVFNVNEFGKINWKKNIYGKIYKKIYKNLVISVYKNNIYVADNIGFIYSISLNTGKLNWIKNHGIPLKSNIKVFKEKIFVINQDNRLLCFNTVDGSKIWDIRSISSFIKLQNFLSLATSDQENIIAINSSGDLFKAKANNGDVIWSLNVSGSMNLDSTDFFKTSGIVVEKNDIIFSAGFSIFSVNLKDGTLNWEQNISSADTPIIDKNKIFVVTSNGHFVILNKDSGKIISSKNILKILKKKKRLTKISGFIMGSGKVYSTTTNGYLIASSASSGQVEYFKKIKDPIISSPIINNGKLYILTKDFRIFGFN